MSTLLSLLISAAVTGGQFAPSNTGDTDAVDVAVRVDLSALPDGANARIEGWVVDEAREAIESAGHRVADQAAHEIKVSVSWFGTDSMDTLVIVELDGRDPAEIKCLDCDEEEWLPKVQIEVARLIETLDEPEETAPEPSLPIGPPIQSEHKPTPTPPTMNDQPRDEKRIGSLGATGIGLSVSGAIGVGVGLGLVLRTPGLDGSVGMAREVVDTRTGGYAALGLGGAALVIGATLITVDVVRRRRVRNTSLLPTPQGVVVVGRF
ncbi:MAG: hypothetical protein JKY37_20400 [Nannocystaceae bacterium]|nr:hypothetical protein [Nannocystaceae bacterium]